MIIRQTSAQMEHWRRRLGDSAGELDRFIAARGEGWMDLDDARPGWNSLFGLTEPLSMRQTYRTVRAVVTDPERPMPAPLGYDMWPDAIKGLAAEARPGDQGVGDIARRKFGTVGASYKWIRTIIGMPCSCDDDRRWLNARFPVSAISAP